MKRVFADTSYWIALTDPADQLRKVASQSLRDVGTVQIITSEFVLTEYLAAFSRTGPYFRRKAVEVVKTLRHAPLVRIEPASHESFMEAFDLYERRLDKNYSLVDCDSMNLMRREGLDKVLTSDHHFEQEGFTILLKQ